MKKKKEKSAAMGRDRPSDAIGPARHNHNKRPRLKTTSDSVESCSRPNQARCGANRIGNQLALVRDRWLVRCHDKWSSLMTVSSILQLSVLYFSVLNNFVESQHISSLPPPPPPPLPLLLNILFLSCIRWVPPTGPVCCSLECCFSYFIHRSPPLLFNSLPFHDFV